MKKAPRYLFIKLPCKTYIRKYFNVIHGESLKATIRTPIGAMLCMCVEKVHKNVTNDAISNSFIHAFNDKLLIALSEWQFQNVGFDFPNHTIVLLNRFMEGLFEQHLHQFCEAGVQVGRERAACIEQFASLYNIELDEDITWEALKKMEYRFRTSINKAINQKAMDHELFT